MTEQLDLFSPQKGNGNMRLSFYGRNDNFRFSTDIPATDNEKKIKCIARKEIKRVKAIWSRQTCRAHFHKIVYVEYEGKCIKL